MSRSFAPAPLAPAAAGATCVTPGGFPDDLESTPLDPYVERILKARVYDVANETPLTRAPRLSARLGASVWLKREDLQPVFSFKLRGAANRIAQLSGHPEVRGVICASAGNHAQGVALAARRAGLRAVIVMPSTTPEIKVNAVAALGGEVVLHGADFDAACAHAQTLARDSGLSFVHPFDDPAVIAGQGTVAMEIVRQQRGDQIGAVFVPVGGGGLIAGMAAYLKSLYPRMRVIGVEPADAACMKAALSAGRRVRLEHVGAFCDGTAVREAGRETFRLAQRYVDEVLTVSNDEVCAAIQDVFEDTRTLLEPAGALAVAGMKRWLATADGAALRRASPEAALVAVCSGANVNFDRLRHIAERADLGAAREALYAVDIPERPGSFLAFCETLGNRNITEFNYRHSDPANARIFVGVATGGGEPDRHATAAAIRGAGFPTVDLSDNELAKLHLRHLVGGRAPQCTDERLFRFEFPERRGALLRFLQAIGARWNISLFHYRNHGSDFGRVLAGIEVPPATADDFLAHLDELGYRYVEETLNPAATAFL